jgi:hypothetical protein
LEAIWHRHKLLLGVHLFRRLPVHAACQPAHAPAPLCGEREIQSHCCLAVHLLISSRQLLALVMTWLLLLILVVLVVLLLLLELPL